MTMTKKIITVVLTVTLILGSIAAFKIYTTDNKSNSADHSVSAQPEKRHQKQMAYETLFGKDKINNIYIEVSSQIGQACLLTCRRKNIKVLQLR